MGLKVGIQLWSVRNAVAADPVKAFETLADIGYKYIEPSRMDYSNDPACNFGMSAQEFKSMLERIGSHVVSVHSRPSDESIDRIVEFHHTIGTKYLISLSHFYTTEEETKRTCEAYQRMGEKCKEAGMMLLVHNHMHEFLKMGEKSVIETIFDSTDPTCVGMEFDTYWAGRGGVDIHDFMVKHGKRIKLVHQKDFPKDSKNRFNLMEGKVASEIGGYEDVLREVGPEDFIEIGEGCMDIQSIISDTIEYTDSKFIILEQDYTALDEFESVKLSYKNFGRYKGIDL